MYGCTTWTLTKDLEKKLDGNYRRMFHAVLNKSWKQHPTKQQLYCNLPPISQTIPVRRTRHADHCCWRNDELLSDVFPWTPTKGYTSVVRLTFISFVWTLDVQRAMADKDGYHRERESQKNPCCWLILMMMVILNRFCALVSF